MIALADVASLSNGGTPSKANAAFWRGDIPWVSPKDMKSLVITDTEDHVSSEAIESSATKLLPAETVLCVVRSGILQHTLPVAITARPMCTNQDILAISPDKTRLDPKFLLFVLKGRSAEILRDGIKTGVTVQSFHNGFFKTFEIPLPPLEEQRRIVAEIESYQKVIDGARQILTGYNPRLDINPEWETAKLEKVCEIKRGRFSHRPRNAPQFYGGVYPFLQTGDVVRANGGAASHTQTLNELGLAVSKLFKPTIVLITIAANIGDTALLTYPACFTDSVVGLTPNERILPKFLEFVMRGKKDYLNALAPQAAQKNITVEVLREVEIPVPPLEEQGRIIAELDAEGAKMEAVRSLLPRFEGKIKSVLDRVWGDGSAARE